MDPMPILAAFRPLDAAALLLLGLVWLGTGLLIEHSRSRPSLTSLMGRYRHEWMQQMVLREMRMVDASILQNQRDGTAFFASTCLIAIGGTLALIGNPDPLERVASQLPHADPAATGAIVWQAKLLPVILLTTAAFLRFVWSHRLFGYFSVMIGAVPMPDDPMARFRAWQAAGLSIRAATNFNRGLRALYFALAALAWLLGAVPLIIAVLITAWILYDREFRSVPLQILRERLPDDRNDPPA